MKIAIPNNVKFIIDTLMLAGHEAYAVGGCVRDAILHRQPGDWDITTSAKPKEVKELFRRTIDTGIEHGTVTVMIGHEGYEVTTYRIDGEYEDNRHPKQVEFTGNLVEDLKRRDFTINAMAYNDERGIIDEFDGLSDINRRMIRCVGTPEHRFEEDALRILRAVRFASQLQFDIDQRTKLAIISRVALLRNISAERIRVELNKILVSNGSNLLKLAYEVGVTNVVLPEFDEMMNTPQCNPHHIFSVGEHTLKSVEEMNEIVKKADLDEKYHSILCWTMLLHDVGKPITKTTDAFGVDHFYKHPKESERMAKAILKRLKFDNVTIDIATKLIRYHDLRIQPDPLQVRKAARIMGIDILKLLFLVQEADILAQNPATWEEKMDILEKNRQIYNQMLEKGHCVSLKELEVNGKDLIELGIKPGKALGETLESLLDHVIQIPEDNNKSILVAMVKEMHQR